MRFHRVLRANQLGLASAFLIGCYPCGRLVVDVSPFQETEVVTTNVKHVCNALNEVEVGRQPATFAQSVLWTFLR